MSDSKSSVGRKPPKSVMPRSRYLNAVSTGSNAAPVTVASRRTIHTVTRTQPRTELPPSLRERRPLPRPRSAAIAQNPQSEPNVSSGLSNFSHASNRQSSPKQDSSVDGVHLVINDSVASAVLPPSHCQRISPRQRSLSVNALTTDVTPVVPKPSDKVCSDISKVLSEAGADRATEVVKVVLQKRLTTLLGRQTKHHIGVLNALLTEVEKERDRLIATQCAQLEWKSWLKSCSLLCAEDKALASIQRVLFGTENCSIDQSSTETTGINFLDTLAHFVPCYISPTVHRLPLRNVQLPTPETHSTFEQDLRTTLLMARLFAKVSEREIERLEQLAELSERLVEELRSTTLPEIETRTQEIQRAIRLLAHEASLRFERIQRDWLSGYQQQSRRL